MYYPTGEAVMLGDNVRLGEDVQGVVVCDLDADAFSDAYSQTDWGYLKTGVLIAFPQLGLVHFEAPDEDLVLVARASGEI